MMCHCCPITAAKLFSNRFRDTVYSVHVVVKKALNSSVARGNDWNMIETHCAAFDLSGGGIFRTNSSMMIKISKYVS
jgi:nitrous oxidase accessory protein NosD